MPPEQAVDASAVAAAPERGRAGRASASGRPRRVGARCAGAGLGRVRHGPGLRLGPVRAARRATRRGTRRPPRAARASRWAATFSGSISSARRASRQRLGLVAALEGDPRQPDDRDRVARVGVGRPGGTAARPGRRAPRTSARSAWSSSSITSTPVGPCPQAMPWASSRSVGPVVERRVVDDPLQQLVEDPAEPRPRRQARARAIRSSPSTASACRSSGGRGRELRVDPRAEAPRVAGSSGGSAAADVVRLAEREQRVDARRGPTRRMNRRIAASRHRARREHVVADQVDDLVDGRPRDAQPVEDASASRAPTASWSVEVAVGERWPACRCRGAAPRAGRRGRSRRRRVDRPQRVVPQVLARAPCSGGCRAAPRAPARRPRAGRSTAASRSPTDGARRGEQLRAAPPRSARRTGGRRARRCSRIAVERRRLDRRSRASPRAGPRGPCAARPRGTAPPDRRPRAGAPAREVADARRTGRRARGSGIGRRAAAPQAIALTVKSRRARSRSRSSPNSTRWGRRWSA